MPKKRESILKELGLKPHWEAVKLIVGLALCFGLGFGVYLWRGLNYLLIAPALALVGFLMFFFTRYSSMRRKRLDGLNREFVDIFTFFGIFVTDGFTVYNALERVRDYCGEEFRLRLDGLLRGIDADKSVQPYVDFANGFQNVAVKEVMLAVYEMVDEGEGGAYVTQFQKLFGRLSDTRHMLDAQKRLERLDTLAFLPLAGAGIAMLALTLSIMEIMGSLMDVF